MQAALEHRAQQRHAAGHMHPPSHPLALEALTGGVQAPGSGLLQALGQ